jgi:sugar transferase (PEP-CTERM system associated)
MLRLFQHHVSLAGFADMLIDAALGFAAVLLAAASLQGGGQMELSMSAADSVLLAAIFSGVMALMYAFAGLYRPTRIGFGATLRRTLSALLAGGAVTYVALLTVGAVRDRQFAEQLILAALLYLLVGLVLVRSVMVLVRKITAPSRVMIVGDGVEAMGVAAEITGARRMPRKVVGLYPTTDAAIAANGHVLLPRTSSIEDLVAQYEVDEIIVAVREQRGGRIPMDQLLACRIRGIPIVDLAAFYERTKCEVPIDSLKASFLVYGQGFVQGRIRRLAKRTFDVVSSAALLVLASPIMLLAMLAIRLDSRGPILYRQERVGLGGRSFMCLKFRSMRTDAEKDGVARWATKNDPRVTRVGAFIRKTRIDELPQLLSVLRGEMSMVGPRPERPSFVNELKTVIPFYDVRHSVKPGVTGWAQVRYSYGSTVEDARRKHQFDLYYVKNNSLFLDLLILIETVSVVLFREGQ